MSLRMKQHLKAEDLEKKVGKLAVGAELETNYPDGLDVTDAPSRTDLETLELASEFIAASMFDSDQCQRFVTATIEERKTLLGVTTQEEIATEVLSEDVIRRETAIGIMLDLNGGDVIRAAHATEKAMQLFAGDVVALRDRLKTWVFTEVDNAVLAGRLTP